MTILAFDVFGTVVDWRGSIIAEGQARWASLGIDWAAFADAWRGGYQPAMEAVRSGRRPWANIDTLHREILDDLLEQFGVTDLSQDDRVHLSRVWHRLDPWPDAREGLARLRRDHIAVTLSNGNVSLLVDLARHGDLAWDAVFSAELARQYKPERAVYLMVAALFNVAPEEVTMVAAHTQDLLAARQAGLRTAFIRRPLEYGPDGTPEQPADFDIIAADFNDLADQLDG